MSKYSRIGESSEARKAYSRHDDGLLPEQIDDDISPEHLEEPKKSFYEMKVIVTPEEAIKIQQDTRGRRACHFLPSTGAPILANILL